MSETLKPGLTATCRITVDTRPHHRFMGDELRVYSTPSLLYDVEVACRDLILPHVGEGKDSSAPASKSTTSAPRLLGMWVEITVTLTEVNGPAVTFEFSARDAVEEVARGKHSRFVVGLEKTRAAARRRRQRAGTLRQVLAVRLNSRCDFLDEAETAEVAHPHRV
jgi:fluoroacetyl-CoA thioesterase